MSRKPSPVLLTTALILLAAIASAQDVRNSSWGDSMEAVKAAETATFHHEGEDELAFTDSSIEGIDGGIIYLFDEGRLVRALYVSRTEYPGGEGVLADYQRMQSYFDEVLGMQGAEQRRWRDAEPEGESNDLAAAVAAEELRVANIWRVGRNQISLVMTGKDGGVFLRAMFQPSGG